VSFYADNVLPYLPMPTNEQWNTLKLNPIKQDEDIFGVPRNQPALSIYSSSDSDTDDEGNGDSDSTFFDSDDEGDDGSNSSDGDIDSDADAESDDSDSTAPVRH